MTLTTHRDIWAMAHDPDRPRFPRPVLVPAGTYEAVRIPNPLIRSGQDFLVVRVGDDVAGMTEDGWAKKAGRPRPDQPESQPEADWSF